MDDSAIPTNFIDSISIKWNEVPDTAVYPFNVASLSSLTTLHLDAPVTFFCGENGTGKSTLLEAISIALGMNPEGGSRNHLFSVKKTHSELHDYLAIERSLRRPSDSFFVRSDTMFNLITAMDELEDDKRYYEGRSLHRRSHGEGILALVSRRFAGNGLYILDEPETGLSQIGQIALLCEIKRLVGAGSQFVIATHSPILLCTPDSEAFQFDDEVSRIDPKESLEWTVLQRFIEDPERAIDEFSRL